MDTFKTARKPSQREPGRGSRQANAAITPNIIRGRHAAVTRALGCALALGDEPGWNAFSAIIAVRLTDQERAALSYASLMAQDPDHSLWAAEAAVNGIIMPTATSFLDTPAGRTALVSWREERDRGRGQA